MLDGLFEFRSIDGSGNNLTHADWGSAGSRFLRLAGYHYADGIDDPAGADRPSAREISNAVHAQTGDLPNALGVSDLFWVWGQFVDHDIDLAMAGGGEAFDIPVPVGDPYFDPFSTGTETIPLTRSGFDPATGMDASQPREQVNEITSFLDASMVYGSDPVRQAYLRADGGKLKTSEGDNLPLNDGSLPNAGPGGDSGPVAGDVRAGENVGLMSMHTIFVREHNRLVDLLKAEHPDWDDEQLYQNAKALVEAEIQIITYQEFLPLLLGPDALSAYSGYDSSIDPQIANIFAAAAYRVGHTMLSSNLLRLDEYGNVSEYGHLQLRDAFFNPDKVLEEGGVDPILRGLAAKVAQEVDPYIVDDVRNFLFGPPGSGGLDLASLNIQRGRDHGLPSYNAAREAYGLIPAMSFADITDDPVIQAKLASIYGSVDDVDVFVGGLAEDHVDGAMVGELFQAILADQFMRIRDGDRFWYENRLDEATLAWLGDVTLAEIITRNTGIDYIQEHALLAYQRIAGDDGGDHLFGGDGRDLMIGFDGKDRLHGGNEDDHLFGGDDKDRLYGDDGDDRLEGQAGNDRLYGGDGNDRLYGGEGKDRLYGGDGDDMLVGGPGSDKLMGGPGEDTFVYLDPLDFGDLIKDFNPMEDMVDISAIAGLDEDPFDVLLRGGRATIVANFADGEQARVATAILTELDMANLQAIENAIIV